MFKVEFMMNDGNLASSDGIEHEGKLWLVVSWLDHNHLNVSKPFRMIRFDDLAHQKLPNNHKSNYMVNEPLPNFLFELKALTQDTLPYEVLEMPDISVPLPDKRLN